MKNLLKAFRKYKSGVIIFCISFCIWLAYQDLPRVYFMHDEWRAQAGVFMNGLGFWINRFSIMELILGLNRSRLLGALSNSLVYYFFPFQSNVFIYIFLLLHAVNSYLIYRIVYETSKNYWISLCAALLFSTTSTSQQSLSWIGAGFQTLFSTFFCFLSILSMLNYQKTKKYRFFIVSMVFAYIGFLFKEAAVVVLLFYICHFIMHKRPAISTILVVLTTVYMVVFRSFILMTYVVNWVVYPLVSLSQTVVPFRFMYKISKLFFLQQYPIIATYNDADTINYFIVTDITSVFLSLCMIAFIMIVTKKNKYKHLLMVVTMWYVLCFIPIGVWLVPRNASYIDSRHMYLPMAGISVLLAVLMFFLSNYLKKFNKHIGIVLSVVIFILILWKQCAVTRREVNEAVISGRYMTSFIHNFKKANEAKILPVKPVYYFDSDRNYYYESNKLPFLLGSGYVLSVVEYPNGYIPDEVLKNEMFIDFGSQGYFEKEGKGYGYYYDMKRLKNDFTQKLFNIDQIVAFSYNSQSSRVTNITDEITAQMTE